MQTHKTRLRIPKLILSAALCLSMAVGLLPVPALAADPQPAVSSNKNRQDYTTYGRPVTSYLYENGAGLTRVEYIDGQVVVEDYNSDFYLQSSRTIAPELPIWGGFYAGETYNFLFFGQKNTGESRSAEVIRVVKYDKSWNRLGQTSLKGANTTIPFDAGSLRCDEYGGYLYVRTCHQMFRGDDGVNHQANMTLQIRQSDMALADAFYDIWVVDWGYISHSFNQFILVDQDKNLVALDHSDSNSMTMGANYVPRNVTTRGAVLVRYDLAKAGSAQFTNQRVQKWCSFSTVQTFAGSSGNNVTGASLGGLAETSTGYVSAYNYDGAGRSGDRNVYLGYTSKNGLTSTTSKVTASAGATTPVLVPTGLEGGYLLWNGKSGYTVDDTLYYTSYGASGRAGQLQTASGSLSDCQPISWNGKLVWYVTDSSAPVFYTLDASGVHRQAVNGGTEPIDPGTGTTTPTDPGTGTTTPTDPGTGTTTPTDPGTGTTTPTDPGTGTTTPTGPGTGTTTPTNPGTTPRFTDVPATHWAYPYVEAAAAKGIVDGVGNGRFNPNGTMTYAEFCVMLDKAFFPEEVAAYAAQASGKPWYWAYLTAAYRSGLQPAANAETEFQNDWKNIANTKLSRYEMARIIQPLLPDAPGVNLQGNASGKLKDWSRIPSAYRQPVAAALYHGVIGGTDTGEFAGSNQITRAQACVIMIQLMEVGKTPAPAEPVTLTMSPGALTLTEGETGKVKAALSNASAAVTYRSSSPSVAAVGADGTVTARSAGTASITASATVEGKTYTASCTVTVKAAEKVTVEMSDSVQLEVENVYILRATLSNRDIRITSTDYVSSNPAVASVGSTGHITGVKPGSAVVTVTIVAEGKTYTAACDVTVKGRAEEDFTVSVSPDTLTLTVGETGKVRGSVTGTSSAASFRYRPTNNSIITTNDDGSVTAVGAGTAQVMAQATVGNVTKSGFCTVIVKEKTTSSTEPGTGTGGGTGNTEPGGDDTLFVMSKIQTVSTRNSRLLTASRMDADRQLWGDISGVTWTNESPELLYLRGSTVSGRGQAGTGYVTAHYKGQSERITIRVIPIEDQIALSCGALNMRADSYGTTSLYVFDTSKFYGQDYTIQWSVDDSSLLTLEEREVNGYPSVRFTGKGVSGDACITCRVTMADGSWAEEYCFVHLR